MSYIYLITPEAMFHREEQSLQIVKIGFTARRPEQRLRDLQCGSPVTLELHAFFEGGATLEQALHETFAPLRMHGEWFSAAGKLRDLLWYFERPPGQKFINHQDVSNAMFDVVFAPSSSHPSMTDKFYLSTAAPDNLRKWFPEAVRA